MEQKLDGDPISRVQWRIRGSLVLCSGRTEHIGGGLWERARSLMDYEVDAHYSEIACGWRTRGPFLLYIYFGSQANSIHIPSCDDDRLLNLFWLPGITSNYFSHSVSSPHLICFRSLNLPVGRQKELIAFLTSLSSSSIYFIIICFVFPLWPRLSGEYLHLWSASRWRSMKTMCASFATWSTAIRVRMEKRLGARWRGSLHTDCQCLGESWFLQARGQAELLQEWCWSS